MTGLACAIAGQDGHVVMVLQLAPRDPASSALKLGTQAHALDYDDTHFDHIGHTSSVICPAVLALGADRDMADVLRAVLVGSEAAMRTGIWLGRCHYQIGFHQTATAGAFGACVARAHLLGLNADQTRHTLGLVGHDGRGPTGAVRHLG